MLIIVFQQFTDSFACMLKGVIQSLGLQQSCKVINLLGLWAVNITLMCIFVFYFQFQLKGIWLAKICTDIFYLTSYYIIIHGQPWETRIERMKLDAEEQQKMLSGIVQSSQELYYDKAFRTDRTDIPHDNRPAGPASVPRRDSPNKYSYN